MVCNAVALMLLAMLIGPATARAADTPVTDAATATVSAVVPEDVGLIQRPVAAVRRGNRPLVLPSRRPSS